MPQVLGRLGYQTAAFGKVAHGKSAKDYGFDVFDIKKSIPQVRESVSKFLNEREDERPLALFVGVEDPHVPWPKESTVDPKAMQLPPQLLDTPRTRVQRSRYLQEVIDLDAYLAELRELVDRHLGEDHLFVFSSDHGAQFPFGKWTLYDEGTRVPLVVARKGHIAAGNETHAMVSWVDLLPTLIDVAGGDVPGDLDGKSFQAVLDGKATDHRERIFTTHSGDRKMNVFLSRAVRTDRYKFIFNPHPEFAFTTHIDLLLRETSGDYFKEWTKAAEGNATASGIVGRHHGRPMYELFDLEKDPYELKNLAGSEGFKAIEAELRSELMNWIASQGDELTVFHEPLMLDEPETWKARK
ncbi:MAG: sulfatase/phosphatase domain-containing protein [Planctomycetota bacterium]